MSKKMLKRSLALGALMAFVITGQAWAEEFTNGLNAHKENLTFDSLSVTGPDGSTGVYNANAKKLMVTGSSYIDVERDSDLTGIYAVLGSSSTFGSSENSTTEVYVHTTNDTSYKTQGVLSMGVGTTVNFGGKEFTLNVSSDKGEAYGIWTDTYGTESRNDDDVLASVNLNAANNNIIVKGIGDAIGIYSMDFSKVEATGNLTINTVYDDNKVGRAILTRQSEIAINKDGKGTVKIDGDITFYGYKNSRDSIVDITLNNSYSYLNGNIYTLTYSGQESINDGDVNGMKLTISNSATWKVLKIALLIL
ncbi:MAG: hypothetical protein IJ320_06750 [Phascolarctobacterium sp.]|nr:hypothetical protein [Phascolarctobacterium sp.]